MLQYWQISMVSDLRDRSAPTNMACMIFKTTDFKRKYCADLTIEKYQRRFLKRIDALLDYCCRCPALLTKTKGSPAQEDD